MTVGQSSLTEYIQLGEAMGGKLSPTENLIVVKADKTQGSGDYQVPANP